MHLLNILIYLVHDIKKILKKYNAVQDKVNNLVMNQCIMMNQFTHVYGNNIPKENKRYTCLSVILLDSIVNVDEKYYL